MIYGHNKISLGYVKIKEISKKYRKKLNFMKPLISLGFS